jgi:predicted dehydrogenase
MSPIRVGIMGLPATTDPALLGAWGATAHLRSLQELRNVYQIVAVANSSVESSQKSIDFHGLSATATAYGTAEDMAADPDVDLVVISVKVPYHLALAKPAIEHKKDVFVEWPLAINAAEAEELTTLAADQGVRAIVGFQSRL